jgi:hypothetical protein
MFEEIALEEDKLFTSYLNFCTFTFMLQKEVGENGVTPLPLTTHFFPSLSEDISFEDDVTVILLLGIYFIARR